MIGKIPPLRLKPGDELTTRWLNSVRDAAIEGSISDLGPGLTGSPTPNGWTIGVNERSGGGFWAKTNGTISARSGTTLGAGSVFLLSVTTTTITVLTDTQAVVNYSSTTGGIPTGTYVFVQDDGFGNMSITAVDCGN